MAELKAVLTVGVPALEGKYIAEMDQWPLEDPELNRISRFYDNLKLGKFTSTKCKKCGHIAYPPGVICPNCWSDELDWVDLPQKAKVVAVTETLAGAPAGFSTPLIIAWLTFGKDSPLPHLLGRILNCKEGQLKEGDEVQFVVFEVSAHPMDVKKDSRICERVYYAFEPVKK
jgi:uncharacterized OB-fold protein